MKEFILKLLMFYIEKEHYGKSQEFTLFTEIMKELNQLNPDKEIVNKITKELVDLIEPLKQKQENPNVFAKDVREVNLLIKNGELDGYVTYFCPSFDLRKEVDRIIELPEEEYVMYVPRKIENIIEEFEQNEQNEKDRD